MSFGCIEAFGDDPAAVEAESAFGARERSARAEPPDWASLALVATMLFDRPVLQNSACLVRKTALEATGGFDVEMPLQEDARKSAARGTRRFGCVFIDRTVIRYRVNPTSLMRSGDVQTLVNESYARMHRKYRDSHGYPEFLAMKWFVRGHAKLSGLANRRRSATGLTST